MSNWDISTVIDKLNKGDEQLFQELYQYYKRDFTCWLQHSYEIDEAVAGDCFQEALCNLYLNAYSGNIAHTHTNLKTYIFAIGKYQLLKRQEKYKAENHVNEVSNPSADEEMVWPFLYDPEFEPSPEVKLVYDKLDNLNPACRRILEMLYLKQDTYQQISEKLGYSKRVLRTKKWRCLKKLRSLVKNE